MQEEYNALMRNNTWKRVEAPTNKNIIGSKWTFGLKKDPNGKIRKYKARLVAKGYT